MDSFGHSTGAALLYSQLGYDALFIGRMDAEEKKYRIE